MGEEISDGLFCSWFDDICDKLKSRDKVDFLSQKFAGLKSDADRVRCVLDLDAFQETVKITPMLQEKSSETAAKLRNEGNLLFRKRKFREALEAYTESILTAPDLNDNSSANNLLALAFGNRSAVLYHLEKYELCLRDIDFAITNGYPDNLIYKLYDRKGKCLLRQGRPMHAREVFLKAKQALQFSDLDNTKRQKWTGEIELSIRSSENDSVDSVDLANTTQKDGIPTVAYAVDTKFIAASEAFGVEYTPEKGRYVVARQDIYPGDVILAEKPYASVLLPDKFKTHCHCCLRRIEAALPCCTCAVARFCSDSCQKKACDTFHKMECKCLGLVMAANVGKFGLLAMRCLTVSTSAFVFELTDKIGKSPEETGDSLHVNKEGQYDPADYSAIYHLVTHTPDRSVNDLFRRAVMAAFLAKCLNLSGYLGTNYEDQTHEQNLAVIGGLILRHLQLLPCNAHEIPELELDQNSVATSVSVEVGAGIYATLSLFNHSCDPGVTRNFYGDTCVVRAIKSISKGSEMADNYGAVYAVQSRQERCAKLRPQYYFTCQCLPCREDWPQYHQIPASPDQITWLCSECQYDLDTPDNFTANIVCLRCGWENDLAKARERNSELEVVFEESLTSLLSCDVKTVIPAMQRHLAFISKNIRLPWRSYNNCQETLKQCYCILGNCYRM